MMKKVLFYLTFLLTTLGGGNSVLAQAYSGSYPYTWDFRSSASDLWTSSITQISSSTNNWEVYDDNKNARPKYAFTDGTFNDIDIVKGLTFTISDKVNLCLDWTNQHVWLFGTLKLPKIYKGYKVTIDCAQAPTSISSGLELKSTTGEICVYEANSDIENPEFIYTTGNGAWIHSIAVEVYNKAFSVNDLRYCPGTNGISADQMEREVGGYHLTYSGGSGVKCNYFANFNFQHHSSGGKGVMTIAMDANNQSNYIRKIEFSISSGANLSVDDVNLSSGTLTATSGTTWTWQSNSDVTTVTFTVKDETNTGKLVNITGFNIFTIKEPTFTKSTPSIIFPEDQSILTSENLTVDLNSSTITPSAFRWDCVFNDGGTGVTRDNFGNEVNASPGVLYANAGTLSPGVATLTASFGGNDFFNDASQAYALIVNGVNSKPFTFTPDEIYLNVGSDITPYINYNQTDFDTDDLTFTAYPSGIVTTSIVSHPKELNRKLCKIVANGTSVEAGKTVVIAAKCKIAGTSDYCYSTLKVHIKAAGSRNFEWMGPAEYTINKGDYMFIPGIIGNSSGNNSYSKASVNAENKSYVYRINRKTKTITWWNYDGGEKYYKIDEGCPDYRIVGNTPNVDTDVAYIFWNKGQGGDGIDTLMIYGNKAGEATLRAFDPQDYSIYTDVTIHVTDPDATEGVNKLNTTYVNNMTFPYTWDFTKNFSDSQLENANPLYWEKNGNSYSMGIASSFNYDYADENGDGNANNNDNNDKLFSDGSALIPQLYGLKISLGNSSQGSWFSKRDRLRLNPIAGEGKPHLQIIGGSHILSLPAPPSGSRPGERYKLLLKVKANGDQARIIFNGGTASSMDVLYLVDGKDKDGEVVLAGTTKTFAGKDYEHKSSDWLKDAIFSYTVQPNEDISLQLNNVDIYWIAFSTEAKTLAKLGKTSYWASTYSYTKDLDLSKSHEAFPNVTAYYASEFSGQNEVKVSQVTNNAVPRETGLLLKATTADNPGSTYFIANAENVSAYSAPSAISGTNYLKANPAVNSKINANTTIGDVTYTNFTLAYRYLVVHADGHIDSDYTLADDWSFYRIAPSGMTVSNKNLAYLQVPGDLYVYTNRRAGDAEGNPASQELLKIVFNDANASETTDVNVNTVTERTADNEVWYTLQGVRVSVPTKGGIYIHKGKKVVVK